VLYDVINYNDVISATDLYESVKDLRFTDEEIVQNIIVEAGNFWDDPRMKWGSVIYANLQNLNKFYQKLSL